MLLPFQASAAPFLDPSLLALGPATLDDCGTPEVSASTLECRLSAILSLSAQNLLMTVPLRSQPKATTMAPRSHTPDLL